MPVLLPALSGRGHSVLSGPQAKNSGVLVLFLTHPTSNSSAPQYISKIWPLSITSTWVQATIISCLSYSHCLHLTPLLQSPLNTLPKSLRLLPFSQRASQSAHGGHEAPVCWLLLCAPPPSSILCPSLPLLIKPPRDLCHSSKILGTFLQALALAVPATWNAVPRYTRGSPPPSLCSDVAQWALCWALFLTIAPPVSTP